MGCDIHSFAEKKDADGQYQTVEFHPFDWRQYGVYGFLANVRNYSAVPAISNPRGLPEDMAPDTAAEAETWDCDGHSHSWLSVAELSRFDYSATVEDRRYMDETGNGGATTKPGNGRKMSWKDFLGPDFFTDLEQLQQLGVDRVVFWFDN